MVRRNKKSLHNVTDYTISFNNEPSLYNIMIFYNARISKDLFMEILESCLNCNDVKADTLYSELMVKNHIRYGVYSKDVAETIASKIRAVNTDQNCCVIKTNNDFE
ncbi:MAG: hypothetical protein HRK26_00940 [Rickettsiaceae bacterium H1]|nr:hypothetical protein [Rickettsiaceae bacterium H1]